MRIRFAALLSACALVACGARATVTTTAGGGASGSAGDDAGAEASAGAGGVDAGSEAGVDGSAGAAGSSACEPSLPPGMGGSPNLGFPLPIQPTTGTVAKVQPDSLALVAGNGTAVQFAWQGPDLTGHFHSGDAIGLGTQNGWQYVASTTSLAAVRNDSSYQYPLIPPQDIPPLPLGAQLGLYYANECSWGVPQCGETLVKLAVEATTDAGVLSVDHGTTGQIAGWQVDNVYSVWASGSMNSGCSDSPARYESQLTVLGPSPINGGP